jgi:integrase
MGTITARKRGDGTIGYTVQIRVQRGGRLLHSESQTFDREQAARLWKKRREAALAEPGALERLQAEDPTLAEVIGKYIEQSRRAIGKTKAQVLRAIAAADIAQLRCSQVDSPRLVAFAQGLKSQPQTVANYLAHLAPVFAVARPAWGYPLDKQAIDDARVVAKRLGLTARSNSRERRPTLGELDLLMDHYGTMQRRRVDALPMQDIILFAIFSTRRLDEITRIVREDLDEARSELIVRDMKHPGEKIGNDVRVTLPPPALVLVQRQPARRGRIFPFNGDSISTSFTRACKILGIEDLHFHDLRHDGISRLFELGSTIPQAATVSGHRTWTSLKRYSHLHQAGDKYAGWKWFPTPPTKEAPP